MSFINHRLNVNVFRIANNAFDRNIRRPTLKAFYPYTTVVVQSTTPGFPREKTARAPESLIASIARSSTRQAVTVETLWFTPAGLNTVLTDFNEVFYLSCLTRLASCLSCQPRLPCLCQRMSGKGNVSNLNANNS